MEKVYMFTLQEVCEMLGVTPRTMYDYIQKGYIRAVKYGKGWHFTRDAIQDFLLTGAPTKKPGRKPAAKNDNT